MKLIQRWFSSMNLDLSRMNFNRWFNLCMYVLSVWCSGCICSLAFATKTAKTQTRWVNSLPEIMTYISEHFYKGSMLEVCKVSKWCSLYCRDPSIRESQGTFFFLESQGIKYFLSSVRALCFSFSTDLNALFPQTRSLPGFFASLNSVF